MSWPRFTWSRLGRFLLTVGALTWLHHSNKPSRRSRMRAAARRRKATSTNPSNIRVLPAPAKESDHDRT